MRDLEAHRRAHAAQPLGRLVDRLDPVVQEERLAAAGVLALERARTSSSSYSPTYVFTGRRPSGGVSITLMSRTPASDICSVRGIGVALIEITSTRSFSWRSSSFCLTPKRCSSSTISSPRSFARTSRDSSRCVPIRMSTSPRDEPRHRLALLGRRPEARDVLDRHRIVLAAAR